MERERQIERSDKDELLANALANVEKLKETIEAIRDGESEAHACERLGIKKNFFRRFVFLPEQTLYSGQETRKVPTGDPLFTGGERMYAAVMGTKDVPSDADRMAEYLMKHSNYSNRETKVIRMRYWEDLSLEEVGKYIGVQRERVRQIEAKALRKARRRCKNALKTGITGVERIENERLERDLAEKEYLKKMNDELREKIAKIEKFEEENPVSKELSERAIFEAQEVGEFLDKIVADGEKISVRLYNILKRGSIFLKGQCRTYIFDMPLRDFNNISVKEVRSIRNLGEHSMRELVTLMAKYEIYFLCDNGDRYGEGWLWGL